MPTFRDYSTEDNPPCFGFADAKDPACNKCDEFEACLKRLQKTRPPCYGTFFDSDKSKCMTCILASMCQEQQEEVNQQPTSGKKSPLTLQEAAGVIQRELLLEKEMYSGLSKSELRSLLKDRGLSTTGGKATLRKRLQRADKKATQTRKRKIKIKRKK